MNRETLLSRAREARNESKYVDFKASLDPDSPRDWCEIIKDVVAMANSGGGVIVFGVKDDGVASGVDPDILLRYDPAKITDKVASYTGQQFADFSILAISRGEPSHACLVVDGARIPIVFSRPGVYQGTDGRDKVSFQRGTVYFRHGAKSEPGNTDDLRMAIDREVKRLRSGWLGNIKKVIRAPAGSEVIIRAEAEHPRGGTVIGRIEPGAGAQRIVPVNADELWPHRQKNVLDAVNTQLQGATRINGHDILCVRRAHDVDQTHPNFMHKPFRLSSPQYSEEFIAWLVDSYRKDPTFFERARATYREMTATQG